MTKIAFERSGGVVGKTIHHELDLNTLPEEEAEYLQRLIEEANFFNLPESTAFGSTPDEFQYRITIDNASETRTVHTTESSMPGPLQPLVKELTMQNLLH